MATRTEEYAKQKSDRAELKRLRSRVRELEDAVLDLEWSGVVKFQRDTDDDVTELNMCHECREEHGFGHAEDCRFGAACARIREEREKEKGAAK